MSPTIALHDSPVGLLTLVASAAGLAGVYFDGHAHGGPPAGLRGEAPVLAEARRQLDAYFAGKRSAFDLRLAPEGAAFQQRVWALLLRIPFGETNTYGALAALSGNPNAARAVGAAVGRNPLSIIVPCHRVVGASGALTGFAGGLDRKRWLLAHEQGERQLAL
jgi:methylated-DNA-[protein]-cysteine S-methyltransferase